MLARTPMLLFQIVVFHAHDKAEIQSCSALGLTGVPHDNDLRNDIVDDATSPMKFNNCNDIVEG